ncbi:hypothetical protein BCR43DRAFT_482994 [Syncephalastrum racemosum]|uniref:J domain-containing protein n=1 Tax=Syncephalastrum racemosum TaxID=13706 RepID=A0A1X2HUK3_SYNRA|nr:hypothetical protein BCR43DRAFT_482994 [Syncephalastrum racemosum]
MPFINPWTASSQTATADPKKSTNSSTDDKYEVVEQILNAADYYEVLGVQKDSTAEQVRRAYIRRSRVCHPDKFVPPYARATESFQLLSIAYETLSNPSSKLMYDLSPANPTSSSSSFPTHSSSTSDRNDNPNDTLQRVLHQLFIEMMDGEFQTMRAFIHALNETNPGMHISEDAIIQIELAFRKMRELLLSTHTYYKVVQFELMRLYELQLELRRLSYFDIWRRMRLSITICKVLLQLPIMINTASREKRQLPDTKNDHDEGILGVRVENALRLAVGLLETGERYATW